MAPRAEFVENGKVGRIAVDSGQWQVQLAQPVRKHVVERTFQPSLDRLGGAGIGLAGGPAVAAPVEALSAEHRVQGAVGDMNALEVDPGIDQAATIAAQQLVLRGPDQALGYQPVGNVRDGGAFERYGDVVHLIFAFVRGAVRTGLFPSPGFVCRSRAA